MAGQENSDDAAAPAGGWRRKLLIGGAVAVLLAAGAFAAFALTGPDEAAAGIEQAAAPAAQPALYTSLHPPLVINLSDASGAPHFMQITLEVMARRQEVINAVREHTPVIRNSLILLYGSEVYEDVVTREGKEKMLADGLAEIRRVMQEQSGLNEVEAVYFTSLIVQ